MNTDNSRGTFEEVIQKSNTQVAEIANKLRDFLNEVDPEITEIPRPAEQHIDYGIGSNKSNEIFAYICPLSEYVRLGFYYGAMLPDSQGLLQGAGKRLRHIKLFSLPEVEHLNIRKLLEAAVKERKQAIGLR